MDHLSFLDLKANLNGRSTSYSIPTDTAHNRIISKFYSQDNHVFG